MKKQLPGGYLLLRGDGSIEGIPPFLAKALNFTEQNSKSVYDFFDNTQSPHLAITRVVRYGDSTEFHVALVRGQNVHRGYRFWDVSSEKQIRFYFVDDSSIHQSHEWEYRKLRGFILNDIENFFSTKVENRLTTIRALAEVIRDSPTLKENASSRLFDKLEELEVLIERVSSEIHNSGPDSIASMDIPFEELSDVFHSWSSDEVTIDTTILAPLDYHIDSTFLDDVIFPIVQNALESKPTNNRVSIKLDMDDDVLIFEVLDRGVGMTRHELERAEDPFFTTKRGHIGMGIPSALERLRKRGGFCDIHSVRKEGTIVRISIATP